MQVLFQPSHHIIVDVIGRFIKDQQVSRLDQRCCQSHPFSLAAGQFADVCREIDDPQFGQNGFRFALQLPGMGRIHLLAEANQAFLQFGLGGLSLDLPEHQFIVADRLHCRRIPLKNLLQHSRLPRKIRVLRQIFQPNATAQTYFSGVSWLTAGQNFQKRRLAGSVDANQADFVAFIDTQ